MTLTIKSIASGSSGNAFLAQTDQVTLLLDAGLPAAKLRRHLGQIGFDPEKLDGIVLSHEHSDHASGAPALARQLGVPIYATSGTLARLSVNGCEIVSLQPDAPYRLADLELTAFSVLHDAAEPVGFCLESDSSRVVLATDLGSVDDRLVEWTSGADLAILDTNHDLHRLWNGPYHASLKSRIASPRGHLSNEQSADCIVRAAERGRLKWAWLAHLSETNNSQRAALAAVRGRLGGGTFGLECVRRSQPGLVWRSTELYLQQRLF